jgi:hypothetical protein
MPQPQDEIIGTLETVHTFDGGPMPTGVSVSAGGRVFVNFPKWGIVVDSSEGLWVLDTGSPMFQPTKPGGPKL